ncbi:peptidoglycan-binding protein LysM [Salegentibacter maritimus]|nr:peptidoglycan-binding protein LysM [Salegentibacter maritimus]
MQNLTLLCGFCFLTVGWQKSNKVLGIKTSVGFYFFCIFRCNKLIISVMGVFSFIKDAGEKIFGKVKEQEEENIEVSEAKNEILRKENVKAASKLLEIIEKFDLSVENPVINIEGNTATVYGLADSQEIREKIVLLIGNSEGIARVDDRLAVKIEAPEASFHTVERGENLSKIAKEYYKDANKYMVVFEANRPMLKDPDKIYPGQVLRIPQQQ